MSQQLIQGNPGYQLICQKLHNFIEFQNLKFQVPLKWMRLEILSQIVTTLCSRAGPQSKKWSDQQITLNATGSIHKKAREKSLTQKKLILTRGIAFEKVEKVAFLHSKNEAEI